MKDLPLLEIISIFSVAFSLFSIGILSILEGCKGLVGKPMQLVLMKYIPHTATGKRAKFWGILYILFGMVFIWASTIFLKDFFRDILLMFGI